MQVFLNMAEKYPQMLIDSIPKIKKAVDYHPNTLCLAAQVLAAVGKLSKVASKIIPCLMFGFQTKSNIFSTG